MQKAILNIDQIIKLEMAKFGWKLINNELPAPVQKCALNDHTGETSIKNHRYNTRNKVIPNLLKINNKSYRNSIFCKGIGYFSNLPSKLKTTKNLSNFINKVKKHLLGT